MKKLDGIALRDETLENLKVRISNIKDNNIMPKVVFVVVGEDEASKIYVKHKERVCNKIGVISEILKFPENISDKELKEKIDALNEDSSIHGILIQLPVPKTLLNDVSSLVNPKKDVDGIHPVNIDIQKSMSNVYTPTACTPFGIMKLLDKNDIKVKGVKVTIIGRSKIVGKPLAILMKNAGALVSVMHTQTSPEDNKIMLENADILVSASGVRGIVSKNDVKNGVIIIDVGIHRINGKVTGDIDFESLKDKVSYYTPVPGGVGPMTIAMLMENLITMIEQNNILNKK